MPRHVRTGLSRVDRQYLLRKLLVPAVATLVAMAIGFGLVSGWLLLFEGVLLANIVTRTAGLLLMYIVPHLVVGTVIGYRSGVAVGPAVAAGVAPVVAFVVLIAVFGGPISTAFQTPILTGLAMLVWTSVFAGGLVLGTKARHST